MKQSKLHIAPLALMMLILYVSPVTAKAVHHHKPLENSAFGTTWAISFSQDIPSCPVCQFEFLPFFVDSLHEYAHTNLPVPLDFCEPVQGFKGTCLPYCALRAPPIY